MPIEKQLVMPSIFLPFILLIIITGCSSAEITGKTVQEIPEETNKLPETYFCPRDNCSDVLIKTLSSAESSVHCAFFDIDLKEIKNLLASKSRSIDVRVVVDNKSYEGIKGTGVRYDDENQLMHNKFCVVDKRVVITGSFNPTRNDAYRNNNNIVLIYSRYIAENYEDEFKELWSGKFGYGDRVKHPVIYLNNVKIENYFCPEDNCKDKVIKALKNARKSIYFMAFSFTDNDIADAILLNDVEIKGVFDKTQAGSKYSQYKRIEGFKLDIKLDNNKGFMHHKVFIIDNETVISGSYNPTGAGSYKNDENILIIHDKGIARKYLEEFGLVYGEE